MQDKGTSRIEIYSFRQTGLIQDQFVLKSSETNERGSIVENSQELESDDDIKQPQARLSIVDMLQGE